MHELWIAAMNHQSKLINFLCESYGLYLNRIKGSSSNSHNVLDAECVLDVGEVIYMQAAV